jgi:hypothetical protein
VDYFDENWSRELPITSKLLGREKYATEAYTI